MGIAGWRIGGSKIIMGKSVCPPVLFTNLNVNVVWSMIFMCTVQMVLHLDAGCSSSSCLPRALLDASSVHPVFCSTQYVILEYTVHALWSAFGQWFNHSPICQHKGVHEISELKQANIKRVNPSFYFILIK